MRGLVGVLGVVLCSSACSSDEPIGKAAPVAAPSARPVPPELAFLPIDSQMVLRIQPRRARPYVDNLLPFLGSLPGCLPGLIYQVDDAILGLSPDSVEQKGGDPRFAAHITGKFARSAVQSCLRGFAQVTQETVVATADGLRLRDPAGAEILIIVWTADGLMAGTPGSLGGKTGPGPVQLDIIAQVDRNSAMWATVSKRGSPTEGMWYALDWRDRDVRFRTAIRFAPGQAHEQWSEDMLRGVAKGARKKGMTLDEEKLRASAHLSRHGPWEELEFIIPAQAVEQMFQLPAAPDEHN